tara:strand:- start:625 stop:891 length:267 start_codon:yes stop_codon:yes gene_type:complete
LIKKFYIFSYIKLKIEMNYSPLLQLLPTEIVKIIYDFLLISTAKEKLSLFIKNQKNRINNINSFIYDLLYNETKQLITDFKKNNKIMV